MKFHNNLSRCVARAMHVYRIVDLFKIMAVPSAVIGPCT